MSSALGLKPREVWKSTFRELMPVYWMKLYGKETDPNVPNDGAADLEAFDRQFGLGKWS